MKMSQCGQCGRRRPAKKMTVDPVWWWRSCRNEESCLLAIRAYYAQMNRQGVGSDNPYTRWSAGLWLRRHRRSAPRSGLSLFGDE